MLFYRFYALLQSNCGINVISVYLFTVIHCLTLRPSQGLNHVTLSVLTFCKQKFKTNWLNENIKFDVLVDLIDFMTIQE